MEALSLAGRQKGIGLIGTGDFTHPAWRKELREALVPSEEGLYTLKEKQTVSGAAGAFPEPRFVITGEISSIYKQDGRVRKVHNLIILPDLEHPFRRKADPGHLQPRSAGAYPGYLPGGCFCAGPHLDAPLFHVRGLLRL